MGRPYKNPPIVEAVCEFRFESRQAWDWTIPGLIYADIKGQYPSKKQVKSLEFTVTRQREAVSQAVTGSVERMQFISQDGTALVQVGPDVLSVNQLRPYSSWQKFRKEILSVLDTYQELAKPKGLKRVGLSVRRQRKW